MHNGAATAVNHWEGWSAFAGNVIVVTIWGIMLVGLTFGLFMWTPFVVAPAAMILASEGLRIARGSGGRGRRYALAGGLLGALSLAYWIFCIAFVLVTGSFPLPGPQ